MRLNQTKEGAWVGTQKEAGRDGQQVEVPTDKAGLIEWLNFNRYKEPEPLVTPVTSATTVLSYTERAMVFEDEWEQFPLGLKLHYAARACEDARECIKPKEVT